MDFLTKPNYQNFTQPGQKSFTLARNITTARQTLLIMILVVTIIFAISSQYFRENARVQVPKEVIDAAMQVQPNNR